ncbi:uncharacterized protein LOC119264807 [Pygocentrus nattereri]|uniref:uncharacterized protein LOC119264807 n=1 Tax=Pygocentrus nattereri TaxID=42514 RepID=UPI0018919C87|nr:uncharacterized protein LOC119264807 [Pygocentrus nattereri]
MKILLFFTLQLISGQVGCVYVIGYPGGDVLIYCEDIKYGFNEKYFCKLKQNQCEDRIVTQAQNRWNHTERFSLYDAHGENFGGLLVVTVKQPSLQDAGSYQCGETGAWNHTVKLTLNSGEKDPTKKPESTVETTTEESKCKFQSVFSGPVIITVCVCVTVLLIGGSALIYKLVHNKTPGSVSRDSRAGTNRTADRHYENASFEDQNIVIGQDNQDRHPNTTQSHSAYLTLNPINNQSHSGYQTLNPTAIQSHSGYQTLNPTAIQSHSGYQTLNPTTIESHSGYQTLNPTTIQSHSGYQTLNPTAIQSHSGYQTLNPTTIESHSGYQTLNPITIQSHSGYQTLNPTTIQSHSGYQTLNPTTLQSHSGYQTLNPTTIQSHSGYQTLNPSTKQSHSGYQTLNPTTIQSHSGYQTLNPNTNQLRSTYQSLKPNINQSHLAYQNLNINTTQLQLAYQTLKPSTTNHIPHTRP